MSFFNHPRFTQLNNPDIEEAMYLRIYQDLTQYYGATDEQYDSLMEYIFGGKELGDPETSDNAQIAQTGEQPSQNDAIDTTGMNNAQILRAYNQGKIPLETLEKTHPQIAQRIKSQISRTKKMSEVSLSDLNLDRVPEGSRSF